MKGPEETGGHSMSLITAFAGLKTGVLVFVFRNMRGIGDKQMPGGGWHQKSALRRNSMKIKQGLGFVKGGISVHSRFARQRPYQTAWMAGLSGIPARDQRTGKDSQALDSPQTGQ